jgi:hypothetical protein
MLRPVISTFVEASEDVVSQRQRHDIRRRGGPLGAQELDRRGAQHFVIIEEGDPLVAAMAEREAAGFLHRR